jgi:hypothetical protein
VHSKVAAAQLHACCYATVLLQAIIAALRQSEAALTSAGAPASSFSSQALQGLLLKAVVPLISSASLPAAAPAASSDTNAGNGSTAHAQLLRLLQLPAQYNPRQLPQGSQVLPQPPHAAAAAVAPVHAAVQKDGVRLQASGEAQYAGDVAARMRGRVLYLASECAASCDIGP